MEKISFLVWILILSFPFQISAQAVSIPTIGKNQYVEVTELLKEFEGVDFKVRDPFFVCVITSLTGEELRFKPGSSFYTFQGKIEKIPLPIIQKDERIFVPPDLVESIFLYILKDYEVDYEYRESELSFFQKKREDIPETLDTIVIDPGHGGKDPGTNDADGTTEKKIAFDTANVLALYLEKKLPNVKVVLTREKDEFISLEDRSRTANAHLGKRKGILYISLHCNSGLNPEARGFEVYYLSQSASTETARELALAENKYLTKNKKDGIVKRIHASLISSLIQRRSLVFSKMLEEELRFGLNGKIPSRGIKKADFSVLRGSLMPAVLLELGYLSNDKERYLLQNKKILGLFVKSITKAIVRYATRKT